LGVFPGPPGAAPAVTRPGPAPAPPPPPRPAEGGGGRRAGVNDATVA